MQHTDETTKLVRTTYFKRRHQLLACLSVLELHKAPAIRCQVVEWLGIVD